MAEIGKVVELKCPNCGAPLEENDKDLQKCRYCGQTIHIEEANRYLNHLRGQIIEWMRTALPLGVGAASSSSVDVLARHNIFVFNILPRLNSEFGNVEINAYETFSKPLIVPPFVKYPFTVKQLGDTRALFSYDAKILAIQPFAVSSEDQTSVEKIEGLARALAHVLIGIEILNQQQAASYKLAAENFSVASKATQPQYNLLSKRLHAISEICLAVNELFSKNMSSARSRIDQAKAILQDTKEESAFDLNLSISTQAIEEEIETANTISRIADIMEHSMNGDQLEAFSKMAKFFETASMISSTLPAAWKTQFENLGRYSELAKWFSLILEAKRGSPSLKIASSGVGNVLFPFWSANITYTFGTGSLWMKKGISVNENALIAATFPSIQGFAFAPSDVVTDIFSYRPEGTLGSSVIGRETSMSIGAQITGIVQNARFSSTTGKVVPPLSTLTEAKQLINEYIKQTHAKSYGKMQIASAEITDLIFISASLDARSISFLGTLGFLQPKKVGDPQLVNSILV